MNKDLFLVEQEGQLREKVVTNLDCDARYLPLLGIRLRQGRNFDKDRTTDAQGAYLVNEAFVRWMGWGAPLGKKIELFGRPGEVIGVVEDFHFASLHQRVEPLILTYGQRIPETGAASPDGTLALARKAWGQLFPDHPFEYRPLDESLARQYEGEARMRRVFDWGAGITVGTACLGLFAMASLAGQRRKKEIGIRKVLGATRESIVFLLLREFLARVLLGVGPALPLAWYLSNRWLESFVYRMPLPVVPLALAAFITLALAVLTTLYHSLRASRINPATTLQAPA
jgi:putative ABC transport system permease protein